MSRKVSEIVSSRIGNAITNVNTWGGLIYAAKAYSLKGDGVTDDYAALNTLISTTIAGDDAAIVFYDGDYVIGTNITIPSNITLWFIQGGTLKPSTGKTVTINGAIEAGIQRIFTGAGTIVGEAKVERVYPQWWGATTGLSSSDSGAAMNSAINFCVQMTYDPIVTVPAGAYIITTPIVVPHGGEYNNITIEGYGAVFLAGTSGMVVLTVKAYGLPAAFENIGKTRLFGFKIKGQSTASIGIMIGKNGVGSPYGIDGVFPSMLRDVDIIDCVIDCKIAESRLWQIENCCFTTTTLAGNCLYFESITGSFCGDHWISNSQFSVETTNTSSVCIKGVVTGAGTASQMNGIHMDEIVCYGRGMDFTSTNVTGSFRDLFITDCAIADAALTSNFFGLFFLGFLGSGCGSVLIDNGWFNAYYVGIYFENLDNSNVRGCKISSTGITAIIFQLTRDCSVVDVKMYDVNQTGNGGGVLKLGGAGKRNKVRGCSLSNTGAYTSQFILIEAAQIRPIATDNTSDSTTQAVVVNSVAGVNGTDYYTAGNLNGN